VIVKTGIPQAESINDEAYMLDKSFFAPKTNTPQKYIRLQFLEAVDIPLASLRANGLTGPLNLPQEIKDDDILRYLNSVTGNLYAEKTIGETVDKTETMQLCAARIGQGRFRQRVIALDKKCIVTGVDDAALLKASHIKAWSESTNDERLDGNNGILLSPHLDKLFDKHLISFSDDGEILVFDENIRKILDKWNIDRTKKYGQFSEKRKAYLKHHREIAWDKKNGNGVSEPELFQSN
jgi:hypothetical protein